ncbi:unnamed protein product [Parascedosporium putredinis]|uniref:cellulase n=1 Tax=Parascedosporium putredinis TaxID=1442378 RepID=A0A9P1MCR1_9PEZI|nr:unnamed protein product [Parascedosporium putredinis]CAI8002126.1 unnamed protein product [Parascedosporium putredinis]
MKVTLATLAAIAPFVIGAAAQASGSGATTRYWDCCKPSPWAVDDNLAYGWAAVRINGQTESDWCCACYELTFTSGPVNGKKMIVQATNTGGDLGENHFDIAVSADARRRCRHFQRLHRPVGIAPNGWGERYGGISNGADCDSFPEKLKPGCKWRFDWFGGADNPTVTFQQVQCPAEIVEKSGCQRNGI